VFPLASCFSQADRSRFCAVTVGASLRPGVVGGRFAGAPERGFSGAAFACGEAIVSAATSEHDRDVRPHFPSTDRLSHAPWPIESFCALRELIQPIHHAPKCRDRRPACANHAGRRSLSNWRFVVAPESGFRLAYSQANVPSGFDDPSE
jgi:hypothetical protein